MTAAEIAGLAEFFSFGTNDLTQMTFGYSRDDAERNFLLKYVEEGILPKNPFQTIDREGVGELMRMCVENGRKARPDLEVGICGEHGGDPDSIEWCHLIGNNVSCSPFPRAGGPPGRRAGCGEALGQVGGLQGRGDPAPAEAIKRARFLCGPGPSCLSPQRRSDHDA